MRQNINEIKVMAENRAAIYDRIIGIFTYLPDKKFIDMIEEEGFIGFLQLSIELGHEKITKGSKLILSFIDKMKDFSQEEKNSMIELLAVDRTKLVRAPYSNSFKAPYENQYGKNSKMSSLLLDLKKAYADLGYVPTNTNDTLDFFCVELDYLKMLNLEIYRSPEKYQKLIKSHKKFLDRHLGNWIGLYTRAAYQQAETDFYKGWLLFLEGFIEVEHKYVNKLSE